MMKKLLILLILPIMAVMFAACDDDKNDDNGATTKLIKEISYDDGYKVSYEYDSQKRVIKIIDNDEGNLLTTTVTYNKNDITLLDSYGYKDVYTLNDQGYVTKTEVFNNTAVEAIFYIDFTYENGYVKTGVGEESEILTFVWNSGNLTKVTGAEDVVAMEYKYSNKLDKLNLDIYDDIDLLLPLKGFGSKNLKSEIKSENEVNTYTYKFDADDYVTEFTVTSGESIGVVTITYY